MLPLAIFGFVDFNLKTKTKPLSLSLVLSIVLPINFLKLNTKNELHNNLSRMIYIKHNYVLYEDIHHW